jgi:hypothetical protein
LKCGASEEFVPAMVYQALTTVTGLQAGRSDVVERAPVASVADAVVDATLPFLNRHVRGLVDFQRLTGWRPGEACGHRQSRCGQALPATQHKLTYKNKSRVIATVSGI